LGPTFYFYLCCKANLPILNSTQIAMKLLLLAPLAVVLFQAAINPLQQQRPQGSIEGTVTRQGSAQPVTGARVTLTRRGGPAQAPGQRGEPAGTVVQGAGGQTITVGGPRPPAPIAPVTTDDRGKFTFPALDEGTYQVQVQANGYVVQTYGQRFPNGPGTPIPLAAGQAMKDANISLSPAANISGRIHDTSAQPLINVPVQLLRYSYNSTGQRTYQSVGAALTNDRGEYRMYWVTPGRYYLLAGRPSTGTNPLAAMMMAEIGGVRANGNEVPAVLGYAFYPGVTEIANARTIDLQPGADLQAVDLALAPKPRTYSIRGKIIDSRTGQPPPQATVYVATQTPGVSESGTDEMSGIGGPSQNYNAKTGTFEIRELMPGAYTVLASVRELPAAGRGGPPGQSSGSIPAAISNSDVEGLTIAVVPAGSLPGRVRVDGQLPQGMTLERIRIRLMPVGTSAAMPQTLQAQLLGTSQVTANADGTFRLNNISPGEYRVDVFPSGTAVFLKDVRFEGAEALNTPIRFSGVSNNGLDLVLGTGGGRIDGTVTDTRSQPVPGTRVLIAPDRARYRTDLYKVVTTDQNGRFVLAGVPPGDYKVFAFEFLEEFAWFDPDVLSRAEPRGRAVHVTETSTETADVRIIPAEGTR
jgi:protocatechuate 3,4-dioxygenase beta subunit